jgi:hypothetical protein
LLQAPTKELRIQTRSNWRGESQFCSDQGKIRSDLIAAVPRDLPKLMNYQDSIFNQSFAMTMDLGISRLKLKENESISEKCGKSDNPGEKICGVELGLNTMPVGIADNSDMGFHAIKLGLRWVAEKSKPENARLQIFFAQRRKGGDDDSKWKILFAESIDPSWQDRLMQLKMIQDHESKQVHFQIPELGVDQTFRLGDGDLIKMEGSDYCRVHASLRSSSRVQAIIQKIEIRAK